LERIRAICEPVAPPKHTLQYQQYFCALDQGNGEQLKANEPKRVELYKSVAAVVRAFGALANGLGGFDVLGRAFVFRLVAHRRFPSS
jgi:type I restriction enzyme R subunit